MRLVFLLFTLLGAPLWMYAQSIDPMLLEIKANLDEISEAKAKAKLELNIDFINMPTKYAELHYRKGKPIQYNSDNFIIIPKRGLDFSWNELFKYSFMTIDRGMESVKNINLKVLNIIPLDNKADFAIITMKIDTTRKQISNAEITTKNEGTYQLNFEYDGEERFPSGIRVAFEMEKIKIPLNFMGKDAEIDKEELKSEGPKTGKIFLDLDWYDIQLEE